MKTTFKRKALRVLIGTIIFLAVSVNAISQNISINTTGASPTTASMLEVKQPNSTTNTFGLYVEHTGSTAGNTYYALRAIANGAGLNKIAAYFSASGGTNNYALIVPSGGGRVGIGTTSPSSLLHVNYTGNGSPVAIVDNNNPGNTTDILWVRSNNCGGPCGQGEARHIIIANANGTNSEFGDIAFVPSANPANASGASIRAIDRDGTNAYAGIGLMTRNAGGLGHRLVIKSSGRVGIGVFNPGGLFELSLDQGRKPGTNTWTIVSDERLKQAEGAYQKGLKEILQLEPITYYYKNSGEKSFSTEVLRNLNVGFSAQQVQKIFPEAVGTDEDGYLNFNMHSILVAYVNAFKEQQKSIEELKAELELLKTNSNIKK